MKARLLRDRRGNILISVGLVALGLVGSVGLAVDATRAWVMRSRLTTALDAASLSAARNYSNAMSAAAFTQLSRDACTVFWANFAGRAVTNPCATTNGSATGFMGSVAGNPVVSVSNDVLTLAVSAQLDTTFMRLLGVNNVASSSTAAALRTITSVEIALALDVTGSMYPNGKIPAMRSAAESFVDAIFSSSETSSSAWISVVPYTMHVNLGTANYARNMVTSASLAQYMPSGAPLRDTRGTAVPWSGCVQARYQLIGGTPGDLTDTPATPASAATQFQAWFAPTTLDASLTAPTTLYWGYTGSTRRNRGGDNAWRSFISGNNAVNNVAINEWALNQNTARPGAAQGGTYQNPLDITGPSLGCLMDQRYAILPLTGTRSTVVDRIRALEADPWLYHANNTGTDAVAVGGTIVHQGLHAAWLTVSPRWSGLWSDTPTTPTLPLPVSANGRKVIVLMTDGVNDMPDYIYTSQSGTYYYRGAPGYCTDTRTRTPRHPHGCPSVDWGSLNYSETTAYGPYGRLNSGNLLRTNTSGVPTGGAATSVSAAEAELNRRLARLCTVIKQTGVHIYTVGFDIASAGGDVATVRALLTACATTTADYFEANNAAALTSAFATIAQRVGRVRLIR